MQRKLPTGRTPCREEQDSVPTTDSPINVGNHFLPRNAGIQPVFSAPASAVSPKFALIRDGTAPVPRATSCNGTVSFAVSPHPEQDPQLPILPEETNAPNRLNRMPVAIAKIKRVTEVCQSISCIFRRKYAFPAASTPIPCRLARKISQNAAKTKGFLRIIHATACKNLFLGRLATSRFFGPVSLRTISTCCERNLSLTKNVGTKNPCPLRQLKHWPLSLPKR